MSQNGEIASDAVPADPAADSVYDFLYHDARRVGSFLAQFDPSGHLTSLKQTETAESGSGMRFNATASANAVVARGGATIEDQRTAGEKETLERAYDPLWTNARELLNFLADRNMVHRNMARARIGQFVVVSGALSILDLGIVKFTWDVQGLRSIIERGVADFLESDLREKVASAPDLNANKLMGNQKLSKNIRDEANKLGKLVTGLLSKLPHTIQARLLTNDGQTIYGGLQESGLTGSSTDLMLKNGLVVQGTWSILGVLDALPDKASAADDESDIAPELVGGMLTILLGALAPFMRQVGRPPEAYGVTPLLIFREVSG